MECKRLKTFTAALIIGPEAEAHHSSAAERYWVSTVVVVWLKGEKLKQSYFGLTASAPAYPGLETTILSIGG